jgi:hypothetical protein
MQIQVINLVNLPPPSQPIRVLENANPSHQPSTTKSANQSIRKCKSKSSTFHHQVSQPEYYKMQIQVINLVNLPPPSQPTRALEMQQQI